MILLDRIHNKPGAATLQGFSEEAADSSLRQELEKLEDVLFESTTKPAPAKTWSWRQLLRQVSRARTRQFATGTFIYIFSTPGFNGPKSSFAADLSEKEK